MEEFVKCGDIDQSVIDERDKEVQDIKDSLMRQFAIKPPNCPDDALVYFLRF